MNKIKTQNSFVSTSDEETQPQEVPKIAKRNLRNKKTKMQKENPQPAIGFNKENLANNKKEEGRARSRENRLNNDSTATARRIVEK